jgi:hypothetical protein
MPHGLWIGEIDKDEGGVQDRVADPPPQPPIGGNEAPSRVRGVDHAAERLFERFIVVDRLELDEQIQRRPKTSKRLAECRFPLRCALDRPESLSRSLAVVR